MFDLIIAIISLISVKSQQTCELGVNYQFEGTPCRIRGDPHTNLFNGARHDYQGQPTSGREQFYYIHHCANYDTNDMPFNIMARHYQINTSPVSGVDYLTIELYDNNGDEYFVFLSSGIAQYVLSNGPTAVSTLYDVNNDNAVTMNTLTSSTTVPTSVGNRFKLLYHKLDSRSVSLSITIDNTCLVQLYMNGQLYTNGRYRMHYVQIEQSKCYKCFSCGLCGSFNRINTGLLVQSLDTCNGDLINYRPGWNAASTPEAYDLYGWTWEKTFVKQQCGQYYDITDNNGGFIYVDPCPEPIKSAVEDECQAALAAQATCCTQIGGTFCAELLEDCKVDACKGANGDITAIEDALQEVFTDVINFVCQIPPPPTPAPTDSTANPTQSPTTKQPTTRIPTTNPTAAPTYTVGYVGCFVDNPARDFSHQLADHTYASPVLCINECKRLGYRYAGLQYYHHCFCSNSYGKYGQDTTPNACSYPCSLDSSYICGGSWRNSVYITGYIGCFVDGSSPRDLSIRLANHVYASPALCVAECKRLNYRYAGLQYSHECFCDNSYGRYGEDLTPGACSMSCYADSNQICGNSWRNSIYDTNYIINSAGLINEPFTLYGFGGLIGLLLLINILCLCYRINCCSFRKYKSYQKVAYVSTDVDESSCDDMQNLKEYQI